jgi:hypothetical protein
LGAQLESSVQLDCYGEISIEFLLRSNYPASATEESARAGTYNLNCHTYRGALGNHKSAREQNTFGTDVL